MNKSRYCPYFWTQLSVEPNGNLRVCCYGKSGKDLRDENGEFLKLTDFKSVADAFNHKAYRKLRADLVDKGQWPAFCDACLDREKSGGSSPRMVISPFYREPFEKAFDSMNEKGWVSANLHSLELTLGNTCNLRCQMCSPYFSYLMKDEFDKLGMKYNKDEVEAIYNYWNRSKELHPLIEDALTQVSQVLFLGGEPLISHYHEMVLQFLVDRGRATEVALRYNSNLTIVSDKLLKLWSEFKEVNIDISLDGVAEVNDFIRKGASFNTIEKNMDRVKETLKERVNFNICSVLQVYNFERMNEWIEFLGQWRDFIPRVPYTIFLDMPYYFCTRTIPPQKRKPIIAELRQTLDILMKEELQEVEKNNVEILLAILKDLDNDDWDQDGHMSLKVYEHKMKKAKSL